MTLRVFVFCRWFFTCITMKTTHHLEYFGYLFQAPKGHKCKPGNKLGTTLMINPSVFLGENFCFPLVMGVSHGMWVDKLVEGFVASLCCSVYAFIIVKILDFWCFASVIDTVGNWMFDWLLRCRLFSSWLPWVLHMISHVTWEITSTNVSWRTSQNPSSLFIILHPDPDGRYGATRIPPES